MAQDDLWVSGGYSLPVNAPTWNTISASNDMGMPITADDVRRAAGLLKKTTDRGAVERAIQAAFMLIPSPSMEGRRLFADAMMVGKPSPGLVDWLEENGHDDAAGLLKPYLDPVTKR